MRFEILGHLSVTIEEQPVTIAGRNLRVVLAMLLCSPNRPVPIEELFAALWEDKPPKSASKNLHSYIHQLRRLLGVDRLIRVPHGYLLNVVDGELDAAQFEQLVTSASADIGAEAVRSLLVQAESCWRGTVFADLPNVAALRYASSRLTDLRLDALERRIELDLRHGKHHDVTAELREWVAKFPLREQLRALLMISTYRCGRRTDALLAFDEFRKLLAQQLGVEPGPNLQEIHTAILRGHDPGPPRLDAAATAAHEHGPAQLPPAVPSFTGRAEQMARLDDLLGQACLDGGAILISAIAGMGGVGKTALALQWGHRVRHQFPDGQLYVNLNGFSRTPPAAPKHVLERFLRALAIPAESIPIELDEAAALFRSTLRGRRMLLLLDNAADAEQVRPLLPGSTSCLTIVTSRSRMDGLVAVDGAVRMDLDRLTLPESLALLAELLGAGRIEAEPAAAAALAQACGYLPLAVRIAAAHLTGRPRLTLAALLKELRDDRLGTLETADDPHRSTRSVIGRSYDGLSWENRRALRLLARIGWATFTIATAAAVLGTNIARAQAIADFLMRASLLQPLASGRYAIHDLVAAFAATIGDDTRPDDYRESERRLLNYSRYMIAAANARLMPSGTEDLETLDTPLREPRLETAAQAAGWLETERANLLDAVWRFTKSDPAVTCDIALRLWPFLNEASHTSDAIAMFEHLTKHGPGVHDAATWASILNGLGGTYLKAGRYQEALKIHQECRDIRESIGDRRGLARSYSNLGLIYDRLGSYDPAITSFEKALELAKECGDLDLEVRILSGGITGVYFKHCEYQKTEEMLLSALDSARTLGSPFALGSLLVNLAETYCYLGQPAKGRLHADEALAVGRQARLPIVTAHALARLADIERDLHDPQRALDLRLQANELLDGNGLRGEKIEALIDLADAYIAAGQTEGAAESLNEALALAVELGERQPQGRAYLALGQIALGTDPAKAKHHLDEAIAILETAAPALADEARQLRGQCPP